MDLKPVKANLAEYPAELANFISNAPTYDSSCGKAATVTFIDKGDGYFLKSQAKGSLKREADMTRYFHALGLAGEVLSYISEEKDWMLTAKVPGADCTTQAYLGNPARLCDILAERLHMLHNTPHVLHLTHK